MPQQITNSVEQNNDGDNDDVDLFSAPMLNCSIEMESEKSCECCEVLKVS
jgi:hypothetical protein